MAPRTSDSEAGRELTRRGFVKGAAATGLLIASPRTVFSYEANEKLRVACIGTGGRAGAGVGMATGQHCVAAAEVDQDRGAKGIQKLTETSPGVKLYTDFRELFDKHDDLDAVWVGTPDHTHFAASVRAIASGAAVYCEKPLTWSIGEARKLREMTQEHKAITQMGNQGHSSEGIRMIVEYIRSGALGDVTEVNAASPKSWGGGTYEDGEKPTGLDWNAWLGPAAEIEYKRGPHPGSWRKYVPYGTGTLGDMGIHTMDGAVWGLRLTEVKSFEVEAVVGRAKGVGHPIDAHVVWSFPARGDMPPVKLTWHQHIKGDFPEEVTSSELAKKMVTAGTLYRGSKGYMVSNSHCGSVRLVPEEFQKEIGKPEQMVPRVTGGHTGDWMRAVKDPTGEPPCSNFIYASKLTEILCAGVCAWRTGEKLTFDMATGRFTNSDAANALIWREPRKGWEFGYPT